ncbi:MAG: cytochrome c oxidase cbb3-type subunit 4 [Pseudohongiellaceae bacterium]
MDINDVRGFSTVLMMVAFAGISWWAFSPKRKDRFTDDANLPFEDEQKHQQSQADRKGVAKTGSTDK